MRFDSLDNSSRLFFNRLNVHLGYVSNKARYEFFEI